MCKIAFLYPGQGAQQAGMGADFYENGSLAKSFLDKVEGCLDFHLKEGNLNTLFDLFAHGLTGSPQHFQ